MSAKIYYEKDVDYFKSNFPEANDQLLDYAVNETEALMEYGIDQYTARNSVVGTIKNHIAWGRK
jgi:hypothetical protein